MAPASIVGNGPWGDVPTWISSVASLFALVLPAWYSALSGIHYGNEQLGWSFLLGAVLITAANVLLQTGSRAPGLCASGPVLPLEKKQA